MPPWVIHLPTRPVRQAAGRDQQGHDSFYARLYVGLWHEAHGNAAEAEAAITQVSTASTAQQPQGLTVLQPHYIMLPLLPLLQACRTQYAQQSGDYMAALARVHCQRRGWQV